MAEIVRTGPTDFEYGRTPSQFDVFGLLDAFTPVRRPVVTPSRTEYTEADGLYYPNHTPAEYGDPVQLSGAIPNEDVYRDFFKTLEGAVTKTGAPQPASMKQYTTRLNNPYQVVDQELVDTLSGLLGE